MAFSTEKILSQIEANLKDNTSITDRTISTFVEDVKTTNTVKRISNPEYSFDKDFSFKKVTQEELNAAAKQIFNSNQLIAVAESKEKKESVADMLDKGSDADEVMDIFNDAFEGIDNATDQLGDLLQNFVQYGDSSSGGFAKMMGFLKGIGSVIADGMKTYQDGVSETTFGVRMESSWKGSRDDGFLDYFAKQNKSVSAESRKINFLKSTPLDAGSTREALYGSMMLGTPYLFNEFSDPTNRTLINSLVKDGRFVSFTPGLPKFNGTSYTASSKNNILEQTKKPTSMLEYLTKNGLDKDFADKDKRYYTFQAKYEEYFAYLETMLNIVWIKLGLAKNGETFNLFTFFNIKGSDEDGGITPKNYKTLIEKYNSSIGFFLNPNGAITESISNNPSGDGDSLAQKANSQADEYNSINYMTGMGTGSAFNNTTRKAGFAIKTTQGIIGTIQDNFGGTISAIADVGNVGGSGIAMLASIIGKVAKIGLNIANDITTFNNTNDLGALIQSFATSNGMKVRYPNLWSDSTYSKGINLNFEFTSPYGDPLSIFKYVYVPFFALLTFGLPRQAAENGLVSPFLVRCDIPGLLTSDLALVADISWTKGGANNLWTKDGLPRAMTVTVSVQDLYPFLAMSKRISFLSANPSFAVFLDSMSGMMSLNDTKDSDGLNNYFKEMINRINGEESKGTNMWNKFNSIKSSSIRDISEKARASVSATVDAHAIPWLHNSSIT